jgi:hypothetical protein
MTAWLSGHMLDTDLLRQANVNILEKPMPYRIPH